MSASRPRPPRRLPCLPVCLPASRASAKTSATDAGHRISSVAEEAAERAAAAAAASSEKAHDAQVGAGQGEWVAVGMGRQWGGGALGRWGCGRLLSRAATPARNLVVGLGPGMHITPHPVSLTAVLLSCACTAAAPCDVCPPGTSLPEAVPADPCVSAAPYASPAGQPTSPASVSGQTQAVGSAAAPSCRSVMLGHSCCAASW